MKFSKRKTLARVYLLLLRATILAFQQRKHRRLVLRSWVSPSFHANAWRIVLAVDNMLKHPHISQDTKIVSAQVMDMGFTDE